MTHEGDGHRVDDNRAYPYFLLSGGGAADYPLYAPDRVYFLFGRSWGAVASIRGIHPGLA
jgi:hypothetical protein